MISGIWPIFLFEGERRFLQSQKMYKPPTYICLITIVLHPIWCWLFIYHFEMHVIGASLCWSITAWLCTIMMTVYIWMMKPVTFEWAPSEWFKGWGSFLKVAMPSLLLRCTELWYLEAQSILLGLKSNDDLAANVILWNASGISWSCALGISAVASASVGNSMGAGKGKKGRTQAIAALSCMSIIVICEIILLLVFRQQWGRIFT